MWWGPKITLFFKGRKVVKIGQIVRPNFVNGMRGGSGGGNLPPTISIPAVLYSPPIGPQGPLRRSSFEGPSSWRCGPHSHVPPLCPCQTLLQFAEELRMTQKDRALDSEEEWRRTSVEERLRHALIKGTVPHVPWRR